MTPGSAASVRQDATDAMVSGHADRMEQTAVPLFWPVETFVLADAHAQARAYPGDRGDTRVEERAWAARVDDAVHGMNCLDPNGLDLWITTHAESDLPHAHEADLVAVWETWLRDTYGDHAETADTSDATDHVPEPAAAEPDELADVDQDGW